MSMERISVPFGAEPLILEVGRMAKQADAAVIAQVGGTVMLVAVTVSPEPLEGRDFFPLMVDYREKFYAGGRIPGGFFKRESRPGDLETLRARITDRAIRPLFPENLRNEVMVYITILSSDNIHPAEIAALNATSLALRLSSVPFPTATAAVRVGRVDGEFVLNPTFEQQKVSDIDLIVAGTRKAINMVEAGAEFVSEEDMIAALRFAHEAITEIIEDIDEFAAQHGKPKFEIKVEPLPAEVAAHVRELCVERFDKLVHGRLSKEAFSEGEHTIIAETAAAIAVEHPELVGQVKDYATELLSQAVRKLIIEEGQRVDGRARDEIRPVTCDAPILPAVHGSALFTRGQTQALGVVTLGTVGDAQMIDTMLGTYDKYFMLHYNFPPFSVGEAKPMRAPGRREIGHGALAERALQPVIPKTEDFPYTIRLVSEILESNGSSSMASVCVGSLALMDAGVPLKQPVAGIAMGLVANEEGKMAVLTDIQGVEDHLGDMDFKVAGTRDGITALQMDIKIEGVTFEIMEQALEQAKAARLKILDIMTELLPEPRAELAKAAPRVSSIQIPVDKIGMVIGPGGKTIRGLEERTGAKIDIQDDGKIFVSSPNGQSMEAARQLIQEMTAEVTVGQVYEGKVVRVTDFGAFVELLPGRDGMVHISELEIGRVDRVEDVCQVGDSLKVKVVNIDPAGKVRLSRKAILMEEQGLEYTPDDGGRRGGGGGGGRGGERGGGGGRGGDRGRGGERGGRGDRERGPRGGGERGGRERRESSAEPKEYGFRERPRQKHEDD
ncbi:MAG TPA: polyribonucleotide nucleotidyltransferase [Candidatus Sumerlaeota bacterium]|nr:polyribonucleotide nucleotidyltransferase [Candidatus Sumerlaeota bacterium]